MKRKTGYSYFFIIRTQFCKHDSGLYFSILCLHISLLLHFPACDIEIDASTMLKDVSLPKMHLDARVFPQVFLFTTM